MEIPAVVVLFQCGLRRPDGQHPIPAWLPLCGEDVNQLETPWRKDTRMLGMSPKILGRYHWGEQSQLVMGSHGPCLHISRGLSWTERAGLLSVSTKDRARTDTRQIVTQDDNKSKLTLGGGYTETNYIFMLHTWGEKGDEENVFFLSLCSASSPEAFSVVYME